MVASARSSRRSKSSASSTNSAPRRSSAPSSAHSPPASPPAAPVIGTPGVARELRRQPLEPRREPPHRIRGRALLRPVDAGGVLERRLDVAQHREPALPEAAGRADGLDRTRAAVDGRAPAGRHEDAARAPLPRGDDQLAGSGRRGSLGVELGGREQRKPGGRRDLDDCRRAGRAQAPPRSGVRADRSPGAARLDRRARRRGSASCPRRRRPPGRDPGRSRRARPPRRTPRRPPTPGTSP